MSLLPDDVTMAVRQYLDGGGKIERCPTVASATTSAPLDPADLNRLAGRSPPMLKKRRRCVRLPPHPVA